MVNLTDAFKSIGYAIPKFDPRAGTILVTDATGVIGHRVAMKLLAAGFPTVRVGVSQPENAQHLAKMGAQVVAFDFDNTLTYAGAFEGVKSVYLAVPHHSNWKQKFDTLLTIAKKHGVRHFVKLSISHALASAAETMENLVTAARLNDPFLKVPLVLMHREIDSKLMKMNDMYSYTILFASHFMSNPIVYQGDSIRKDHCFKGASQSHGVAYVSPNDVADVAVRALLAPRDFHRTGINLTGPEAIKDVQIAEILR